MVFIVLQLLVFIKIWHNSHDAQYCTLEIVWFPIESNYFLEFFKACFVAHASLSPNFICLSIFHFFWSWKQFFDLYSNWETNSSFLAQKCFRKMLNKIEKLESWECWHQTFPNYQQLLRNVFGKKSFSRQIRNLFGEFRSKLSMAFDYHDAKKFTANIWRMWQPLKVRKKILFLNAEIHSKQCHLPEGRIKKSRRKDYDCFLPFRGTPERRV